MYGKKMNFEDRDLGGGLQAYVEPKPWMRC